MEDNTAIPSDTPGRRAAAYWFIDGLPEILFGIVYLVWGIIGMAWGFHLALLATNQVTLAVTLAFLLLWWKDQAILDYLKTRLTYPRTGYVRPPAEPAPQRPVIWVRLGPAPPLDSNVTSFRTRTAFVFFLASRLVPPYPLAAARWSVPIVMAVAAVVVYASNRREGHPYSWQSTLAIALAGLLSAGLEVPPIGRQYIPLLIGGAWLLAHGIPTLVRYLRTYPAPKREGA